MLSQKLKAAKVIAIVPNSENQLEIATDNGDKFTTTLTEFQSVIDAKEPVLVLADAVNDRAFLQRQNADPQGIIFDVKLADSLLTAGLKVKGNYSDITQRHLGETKLRIDPSDLLQLRETLRQSLTEAKLVDAAKIEFEATAATAAMQNQGFRLDLGLLKQKQLELSGVKTNTATEIKAWLTEKLPREIEAIEKVDWASNTKVHKSEIRRLFKEAGVPLENSLSKDTLKQLTPDYPIVAQLINHRVAHHRIGQGGHWRVT